MKSAAVTLMNAPALCMYAFDKYLNDFDTNWLFLFAGIWHLV